jgi:hypothetical protein
MPAIDQDFLDAMQAKVHEARRTIKLTDIVRRLQQCALGLVRMSKEEIKAAEILLKKGMPDLRELEVKGEIEHKHTLEDLVTQSMQPAPFVDPLAPDAPPPTQH